MSFYKSNLNKANPDTFQVIFPKIPGLGNIQEGNEFILNIFSSPLPSINITELLLNWQGKNTTYPAPDITFDNWTIGFKIDNKFYNYKMIYNWLMLFTDNKEKTIYNSQNLFIDATLLIKASFNNTILKANFKNIFPISLGSVEFNMQAGDTQLISDVTFAYTRFEIE